MINFCMIDPMCHPIVTRAKLITIERNNHLMAIMILAVGAFIDLRQRHRLHREMSIQIKLVMQQTVQHHHPVQAAVAAAGAVGERIRCNFFCCCLMFDVVVSLLLCVFSLSFSLNSDALETLDGNEWLDDR